MSYILLIEDNQNNADMIIRLLESANYTVKHFMRGFDGMKAARQERPHLILVDFNLPDVDGTNIVLVLKQQLGRDKAPPFIAVTARASALDEQYAMRMGCDAFVTKPIDPEAFLALINEYMGKIKPVGQKGDTKE
jgi:DNA-binding response OmpR family regulator